MPGREITYADELLNAGIVIHIYPGADAVYELYEDAGDGYGYEQGEFSKRRIIWNEKEKQLKIEGSRNAVWEAPVLEEIFFHA